MSDPTNVELADRLRDWARGKYVWDLWYEGTLVLLDKAAES